MRGLGGLIGMGLLSKGALRGGSSLVTSLLGSFAGGGGAQSSLRGFGSGGGGQGRAKRGCRGRDEGSLTQFVQSDF